MKCLYLVLILATIIGSIFAADVNVYKKDFDETGKAYYFTPDSSFKGQKIAVGEDCTKVVVTVKDANGQTIVPSAAAPLSSLQGTYDAQIIRYPGGKCTLPDTQKYNKEVIQSKPEDLVNYYHGKQAPLAKYSFKTENNSQSSGLFSNKWVLIAIGAVALILILLILFLVVRSRKGGDDDEYKRFSNNNNNNMKTTNNSTFIGMENNESKEKLVGSNPSITAPINNINNYNSWDSPSQKSKEESLNTGFLTAPAEPKRVTSITYEEQQNFSNLMKNAANHKKSPSLASIPEEYEKYKSYEIVRKFTPQRNDELVVDIGNIVKLIKSFEDGWTLCYNVDTGKEGYIPKNKLAILDRPQKPQNTMRSETASTNSNYSGQPLLHSESGNSLNSGSRHNRKPSQGQRGGPRNAPQPMSPRNKYYRRPSNDSSGYVNSNQRNPNRYDM